MRARYFMQTALHGTIFGVSLCLAGTASAQDAGGNEYAENSDSEIIVTAQRRTERLQDVPIAVTAVGSEALSDRNVVDISSLRGAVPGLTISSSGGVNASNIISIRGVTGQPLPIGAGQAAAIYLDGVYLSRPDAAFFGLDDIERIEVLRGPQGTLYGRNATAGAINIVTRDPGNEFRGGFDLAYTNFDGVNAKGSVSGPLATGLSFGLSGSYTSRAGHYTNTVTGNNIGDRETFTLRGKLRYASPDGSFDAVLAGDISNVDGLSVFRNQYSLVTGAFLGIGDPNVIAIDAGSSALSGNRVRAKGASFTMNFEAGTGVTLTSISSYRRITAFEAFDLDATAAPALLTAANNFSRSYSQELRANVVLGPLTATLGANYYDEQATWGGYAGPPVSTYATNNPFDTTHLRAAALFGQLELALSDKLTVVGGLRFNHEDRDFTNDYRGAFPTSLLISGNVDDKVLIPSIGVNFKAAPDILIYAKVSQGYQAPGFNVSPGAFAPADTFDAEKLWAYETGIKSQFLDRRVTLNLSGFYYDYTNIQVRSVPAIGITTIDNAASATVKGVEASLEIRPFDGLTLSGQATYLDASYGSFCQPISGGDPQGSDALCAPGLADRSGNRLSQAPKWSGGLNMNYKLPVGNAGSLRFNAGYSWESPVFFTAANESVVGHSGWNRLDAKLGFQITNGPEFYVFGRNLTDRRYVGYAIRGNPRLLVSSLNDPLTYGIGAKMRF